MAIGRKKTDQQQQELVESAHVKFTGMSGSALDTPAQLGDEQTFTVTARCIGTGTELRKDGERREVRRMEVIDVVFGKITPAPKDKQLALVGDDPIGDDEDQDDEDDDGAARAPLPSEVAGHIGDPFGGR